LYKVLIVENPQLHQQHNRTISRVNPKRVL
jgi:hypothetical protein